jgi:hypothetical protein
LLRLREQGPERERGLWQVPELPEPRSLGFFPPGATLPRPVRPRQNWELRLLRLWEPEPELGLEQAPELPEPRSLGLFPPGATLPTIARPLQNWEVRLLPLREQEQGPEQEQAPEPPEPRSLGLFPPGATLPMPARPLQNWEVRLLRLREQQQGPEQERRLEQAPELPEPRSIGFFPPGATLPTIARPLQNWEVRPLRLREQGLRPARGSPELGSIGPSRLGARLPTPAHFPIPNRQSRQRGSRRSQNWFSPTALFQPDAMRPAPWIDRQSRWPRVGPEPRGRSQHPDNTPQCKAFG